jgi:hypothetical protein
VKPNSAGHNYSPLVGRRSETGRDLLRSDLFKFAIRW